MQTLRKNRSLIILLAAFAALLALAINGMETKDWVITLLRGLSVGAITFLVASGFSLIFGLMDVLNLAHGTFFMLGAYIGWTVAVRPDTFVDALTPVALLAAGLLWLPTARWLFGRRSWPEGVRRWGPGLALLVGVILLAYLLPRAPITTWDVGSYETSPTNYAFAASQGQLVAPEPEPWQDVPAAVGLLGLLLGSLLSVAGFSALRQRRTSAPSMQPPATVPWANLALVLALIALAGIVWIINDPLSAWLLSLDSTATFALAVIVAFLSAAGLGWLMEKTLIQPLYATPIYTLMMTLGVSVIGVELVRAVWGAPEFTMPRPSVFNATGDHCPAESLGDVLLYHCSTLKVLGGRIRTYNELFIPVIGLIVLVGVWLLLKRTRIGMIVRAGVQDSEMVEALGINVRAVFTQVFSLGVGLAALGGVIAAPYMGLTTTLGESLLINVLIALAIGGLTSYPGAAIGSLMLGLLQQFIIKYGQIGITLPFLEQPFKPTPPLVPASTIILMVVVLLVMPNGLLGRKE